jgi:signal transduction histidine kinase
MNPLVSEIQDIEALQELGRVSVQIVHDIKNQINGLKLYATFLRKRMEKSQRPEDELETIIKLMNGLERTANDLTLLVRYGRPIELKLQPHTDLVKILTSVIPEGPDLIIMEDGSYEGSFDQIALSEALKNITASARSSASSENFKINLRNLKINSTPEAIIEWNGVKSQGEENPFNSFVGSDGLRLALAAKVIKAHGGVIESNASSLVIKLPIEDKAKGI